MQSSSTTSSTYNTLISINTVYVGRTYKFGRFTVSPMELLQAYGSDEESVEHERIDKTPPISPAHKPPPCSREPLPKRINSHASSSRLDSVQTTGGLIVDSSSSHNVYFQKTDGAPVSVDLDSRPSDFSRGLNHHDDIAAASPYCFFDNRAGPPLPPPLYAQPLLPLYDPFAYMPPQRELAQLVS